MRLRHLVALWPVAAVACLACVGDEPTPSTRIADAGSPETSSSPDGGGPRADGGRCDHNAPFGAPISVGAAVNTADREGGGRLSRDGLHLYFHRGAIPELYVADRTSSEGEFVSVRPVSRINSPADEYEPSLGEDDRLLVFGSNRGDAGVSRLWYARLGGDGAFGTPAEVFDGEGHQSQPYLADNGRALYFTVRGPSSSELFVSHRLTSPREGWSEPDRVPGIAPSSLDQPEGNAVATADEMVLYYTRRANNDTVADVLRRTRTSQVEDFGPEQAVDELNSPHKDVPSWVSDDDCEILISSFRTGNGDILIATRPLGRAR